MSIPRFIGQPTTEPGLSDEQRECLKVLGNIWQKTADDIRAGVFDKSQLKQIAEQWTVKDKKPAPKKGN